MATPFFQADSASVTILRPLASSAFGTYTLELPAGLDVEDVHDFEAPGNQLGYVATLNSDRRVGGLARRFVRADVSVTATDPADPDRPTASDVDQVLTAASEQVSSEFFLESDVSKSGLGPWTPLKDFQVGDRSNTDVWGHVVNLPVTRIEPIISDHDVVDWRVHNGGQLVSDEDARLVENEVLQRALIQDRRELMELEVATGRAQAAADWAGGTAGAALRLADPPRNLVPVDEDGRPYWTLGATRNDSDLPQSGEPTPESTTWTGYSAADVGAGPEAFVELSDQIDWKLGVWVKQPGSAYVRLVDEHGEDVVAEWRQHPPLGNLWFPQGRVIIEPISEEWERYEFVFRLKPGTRAARVVVESPGLTAPLNELGLTVHSRTKEDLDAFQSAQIAENRALHDALELQVQKIDRLQRYLIGSTHENIEQIIPNQAVSSVNYTWIYEFTTAIDIVYDLYWRIGWDQADRGSSYEMLVSVNGVDRYAFTSTNLGPLTLFGESYARQSMTRSGVTLQEGDTITFWVWSNASSGPRRRIRDGVINLTQVI